MDKKETKSSKKDDKQSNEHKKSNNSKKTYDEKDKSDEQVATQEQVNTQEQQPVQSQKQTPTQQEPTDQEKMEANAKVAKEHGFTGIPNGDVGMLDENQSPDDDSEQIYDYENNGVQRTPSEQKST